MVTSAPTRRIQTGDPNPTTFMHLVIALVYAMTVVLFVVWILGWDLAPVPEPLRGLAHEGWTWLVPGFGSALFAIFSKERVSPVTIIWTMTLIVGMFFAIWLLPRPLSPQLWTETELNGGHPNNEWSVRFDGNDFDCPWTPGTPTSTVVCRAIAWGNYRVIERHHGDNRCTFFGTLNSAKTEVIGTYQCEKGGYWSWSAKVHN